MPERALLEDVAAQVGSIQEARWIVEEAIRRGGEVDGSARIMVERRRRGEPLQYVLGTWSFRTIELAVDPRGLIPRPETEQLVESAMARWRQGRGGRDDLVVVDLGTGSGAIALSIATELAHEASIARVVLVDAHRAALDLAQENADRLGVAVEVCESDWFEKLDPSLRGGVHLLVSNPPYVAEEAEASLAPELGYEPRAALIAPAGSDGTPGFRYVEEVLVAAQSWLAPGGVLAIEMAEHHVEVARRLADQHGLLDVASFRDLSGKPRGIVASAP